jgi:hypothetical protein
MQNFGLLSRSDISLLSIHMDYMPADLPNLQVASAALQRVASAPNALTG